MRQSSNKKYILASIIIFFAASAGVCKPAYAVFTPGQTSDPNCQPTDSGCNVVANIFSDVSLTSTASPPSPAVDKLYNLGGILYWSGGAVSGGSGISSMNGLTTGTQTFDISSTGTDFTISSSTGTHTFNLPNASSANRGLLTSADWTIFNAKENAITAGTSAQYYRGDKTFQTLDTSVVPENTNLYYTTARFNTGFSSKTTDDLSEGATNKYFADTLARNSVSAITPLSYDSLTGIFSIGASSGATNGYLSSADWTTFNNKQGTALNSGLVWVGSGSNVAAAVSISNDATISNTGALTISNDAITSGKILNGTILDADINSLAGITITKISGGSNIITSLTTPSGSNANGGSISSNVLTLSLADTTNPGLTSTSTQTFAGSKTFNNDFSVNGNSILGDASTDTATIKGNTLYIPNGLNFSSDGATPYSVLKIQNGSQNFGGLVESGGFFGNNSYFSEEFNADTSNTITADSAIIGDSGQMYFDTTSNNVSYTAFNGVGGFARMTFGTTNNTGGLIGFGAAQNTLSTIFSMASLPVVQMKVRTNVTNANNDIVWGLMDRATAAPVANDTLPSNGIFFWTNNDASWVGVVRSAGSTVGSVTCPGSISTTAFALGRIQVESATSVRFFMDYDVSDGVSFTDCGAVSGAGPTLGLGVALYNMHTETTGSRQIDLDYIRVWQDDSTTSITEQVVVSDPDAITQYNYGDKLVDGLELFNDVKIETPDDAEKQFTYYKERNMTILPESVVARIYAANISTEGLLATRIGVGTKNTSYRFQVGETSNYGYVDGFGAWQSSSDERFKENMTKINNALSLVGRMEGIRYNVIGSAASQIGFSAQEMEKIVPEIVSTDKSGYKGIAYAQLTPIIVNAINEQQSQIDTLMSQLASISNNQVSGISRSELDNLIVSGAVVISGHVVLDKDSVGEAVIKTGETSVKVTFSDPYDFLPIITATSAGEYAPIYVKEIDLSGFVISLGNGDAPQKDLKVFWHAFSQNGKFFESAQSEPPTIINPAPVEIEPMETDNPDPPEIVSPEVSIPENPELPSRETDSGSSESPAAENSVVETAAPAEVVAPIEPETEINSNQN